MEKKINILEPGTLSSILTPEEKSSITSLILTGKIDARDFKCMRDELPSLRELDLEGTSVAAYYGEGGTFYWLNFYNYIENEIPIHCFLRLQMTSPDDRRPESALTKLILPNNITSIGDNAFTYHKSLTQLIIPDSVKVIGKAAFQDCAGLELLDIGTGVIDLGVQGFLSCKNLKTILMRPIIPPAAPYLTFRDSYNHTADKNCPIVYVPDESLELYQAAEGFEYYKSYTHPQTGNFIEGIVGLSRYTGEIPNNPPIIDPPIVIPPIDNTPKKFPIFIEYSKGGRIELNGKKLLKTEYTFEDKNITFTVISNKGYKVDAAFFGTIDVKSEITPTGQYQAKLDELLSTLNVTFKKIKKSWTRDEVEKIIRIIYTETKDLYGFTPKELEKWIDNNL